MLTGNANWIAVSKEFLYQVFVLLYIYFPILIVVYKTSNPGEVIYFGFSKSRIFFLIAFGDNKFYFNESYIFGLSK